MRDSWKRSAFWPARRRLARAEKAVERQWWRLRKKLGVYGKPSATAYRSLGEADLLIARGRVFHSGGKREAPSPEHSGWRNARSLAMAVISDEAPNVLVRARFGKATAEGRTDDEGFFRLELPLADPVGPGSHRVELTAPELGLEFSGEAFVSDPAAGFGVISDVDDTVLVSSIARPIDAARLLLFRNAHTRTPLEGAQALYQSLHQGAGGAATGVNPFFYVSSGPWNLYPLVREFLDLHEFPKGPILMQDFGFEEDMFVVGGHEHKLRKIDRILATKPRLRFLLVGDSTQSDPAIYAAAVERHPGRIAAVYIRDMSPGKRREAQRIAAKVTAEHGVDMLLIRTSAEAARHAEGQGWIRPSQKARTVRQAVEEVEEKEAE